MVKRPRLFELFVGPMAVLPILLLPPASFAQDFDADGIDDVWDNCVWIANGPDNPLPPQSPQADTDVDGVGNRCDCDFDQNGTCGFADFSLFLEDFGEAGSRFGTDMNDNGIVDFNDFSMFLEGFGASPGPQGAAPSITAVSPENTVPGSEVTITGERFSSNLSENAVYFNEVSAEILAASATELVVEVPIGADLAFVWVRVSVIIGGIEFPSSNRWMFLVENVPAADFRNVVVSGDSSMFFNAELFESYAEGDNYNMLLISNLVNFASNAPEKILLDFSRTSATKRIDDWKIGNNWQGPCGGSYNFGTDHTKLSDEERRYFSDYLGNCLGFEVETNPPGGSALNLLYPDGLDQFKVIFIIAPVSHYSVDERLLLRQWSGQFGRRLIITGDWKEYEWFEYPEVCSSTAGFPPGRVNSLLSDLFSCKSPTYPPQLNNDHLPFVSGADCESVCSPPKQFWWADTFNVIPGVTEGFTFCHWLTTISCYNLVVDVPDEDVALIDASWGWPVLTASYVPRCPDDLQIGIIFDGNVSRPVPRDPPGPISVDNRSITVCAKHTVQGLDLGTANPNINGVPATTGDPFNRFFCADIQVSTNGTTDTVAELSPPGAPVLQDTIQVRMDDENIHLDHYVMSGRLGTDPVVPPYSPAIDRTHLTDEKEKAGIAWATACVPLGVQISSDIHESFDILKVSRNQGLYILDFEEDPRPVGCNVSPGGFYPVDDKEWNKLLDYRDPTMTDLYLTMLVVRRYEFQGVPIATNTCWGFANGGEDPAGDFAVYQAPTHSIDDTEPLVNLLAHELGHNLTKKGDNIPTIVNGFLNSIAGGAQNPTRGTPALGTDMQSNNPTATAVQNCQTAIDQYEAW